MNTHRGHIAPCLALRLAAAVVVAVVLVGASASASRAAWVDPALERQLETAEQTAAADAAMIDGVVRLGDRADVAAIVARADREGWSLARRHREVVAALQDHAESSQASLRTRLHSARNGGLVDASHGYWIDNAMSMRATASFWREMAGRGDVAAVYAATTPRVDVFAESDEGAPPPLAAATEANIDVTGAPTLWKMGIDGSDTLAAFQGSGADVNHPAFGIRYRGLLDDIEPETAWLDPLFDDFTPSDGDEFGSGTHLLGVMLGGDGIGMAPGALWIGAKTVGSSPYISLANILEAFQWAADPDGNPETTFDVPDVFLNGWSMSILDYGTCRTDFDGALEAIEAAGVPVIFSAGNDGHLGASSVGSPASTAASLLSAFAVGALAADYDTTADFSSRGPSSCDGKSIKPELVAPGTAVRSSVPGGGYALRSGSGVAAAHVAGAVLLLRQAFPEATPEQIKFALWATATDLGLSGDDNRYGNGRLDVTAAYAMLHQMTADSDGRVTITPRAACEDTVRVEVVDGDLSGEAIEVQVLSDTEQNGETLELAADGPGRYVGSIPVSDGKPGKDGTLQVRDDDGIFAIYIDADDGRGGTNVEKVAEGLVECGAPVVVITQPTPGESLSGVETIAFTVDGPDNFEVASAQLSADGVTWVDVSDAPTSGGAWDDGAHDWDTTKRPNGAYEVRVRAYDADNNVGVSAPVVFYVSNDASVTITAPARGSSVSGTARISFDADPIPFRPITGAHISVDGGSFRKVTNVPTQKGNWKDGYHDWDTTSVPNGRHAVVIRTTDENGRVAYSSRVTYAVDNAMQVRITSPTYGEALSETATVAFQIEPAAFRDIEQTQLRVDGGAWTDVSSPPTQEGDWDDGTHALDTAALADGVHSLQVRALDDKGVWGYSSVVGFVAANGIAITWTWPEGAVEATYGDVTVLELPLVSGPQTITFDIDPPDDLDIVSTRISIDGRAYVDVSSPPTGAGDWDDGAHAWSTVPLPDGSHTAQVRAEDSSGRVGYSSLRKVTVSNDLTVRIIEPDAATLVTGTARVLFTVDGNVGPGLIRVQKSVDGGNYDDVTMPPTSEGHWDDGYDDWDTTAGPDGAHSIQIRALRANGAWSNSNERQVVVDNTPPRLKQFLVDYAPDADGDGSSTRPGRTVEVRVLARDAIAGVASDGVTLDLRTLGLGTPTMNHAGPAPEDEDYELFTLRVSLAGSLANKTYNIGVTSADRLGNRTEAESIGLRVHTPNNDDNDDGHACATTPIPEPAGNFDAVLLVLMGAVLLRLARRR
ncbi:MAG: S8 family serine peptidase [Deltaproteobacteria bacterium]|nr:S8 family serine peptidase [Deltaproteobacteria bacterium]